jgi:hypothetical protein
MLGLLHSILKKTGMPPDDWIGLAKSCLSAGDYLLQKTDFVELCQEQANCNLAHSLGTTADMLMQRGPFGGIDNQLQYLLRVYQQIAITGTRAW